MGRKTNKGDLKLKELLGRKNNHDLEDDFEREALEGFGLLKNDQEAFDLKEELDERMEKEFSKISNKRRGTAYWLAAAGLFLVAGLSVYLLLLRDQKQSSELKELAVSSTLPTSHPTSPPSVSPETMLTPPAPEAGKPEHPKKALEIKRNQNTLAGEKMRNQKEMSQSMSKPVAENGEMSQTASDRSLAREEELTASPAMAYAKTDVQSERGKQLNTDAFKNKDEDARMAPVSPSKKNPTGPAAKPVTQVQEQSKTVAADSRGMSASDQTAALELNTGNCYYDGGEMQLQKELTPKLAIKNLDKHFEAVLFINSKGRVTKVEFTKHDNYNAEELKKATAVLQTLSHFSFVHEPGKGYLCEYKLVR